MEFDPAVIPFTLFLLALIALSVGLIVLGHLCGPKRPNPVKAMPYESGVDPFHDTARRFHVRYHVLAVVFLVFDVELLILYPWVLAIRGQPGVASGRVSVAQGPAASGAPAPVATDASGGIPTFAPSSRGGTEESGFSLMAVMTSVVGSGLIFFALLTLGYIYDWRRRAFDWS
ncbi:NADH ubiquinone oxidoreductase chain A [Thermogutta terrifontis]|uniref:NADH-quinone oxidoreductase subunit n=1 Tax=Thermogutta terrifontis TaxID=1331910 RepID=A0A286RBP2_9BACT|nr:NADH-quinone oxidoreductase subunit A [Thermogutta terrifontis]ASV73369.1 NADH ubiquinone oxidoreductase chain A [Thermogutta terrifontis]